MTHQSSTIVGHNQDLPRVMAQSLKEARRLNKLTQADLAKQANTTQSCISRAESGDISDVRNWLHLVESTGASISSFHITVGVNDDN